MTVTRRAKIEHICYVCVSHSFAKFHDKKNQGPAFTWERFPEMMKWYCLDQARMQCHARDVKRDEIDEYASWFGKQLAERFMEQSDAFNTIK